MKKIDVYFHITKERKNEFIYTIPRNVHQIPRTWIP